MEKTMTISIMLSIDGEARTTNEFKIENAPKEVVIQLEKLLLEALSKFMLTHQN